MNIILQRYPANSATPWKIPFNARIEPCTPEIVPPSDELGAGGAIEAEYTVEWGSKQLFDLTSVLNNYQAQNCPGFELSYDVRYRTKSGGVWSLENDLPQEITFNGFTNRLNVDKCMNGLTQGLSDAECGESVYEKTFDLFVVVY